MILPLLLVLFPSAQDEDSKAAERLELAELQPEINSAIDDGVAFLLERQLADGSWDHLSEVYPNGATALCVLALMKSGLSPDHPAVSAALKTLVAQRPRETYSAGVQLMALEATGQEYYLQQMEPVLDDLLSWQTKGGWSYPADRGGDSLVPVKGTLDLSNIQYATLGLRAASFADYEIKDKVWKNLVKETLGYQTESGGFHYWKEEHSRFAVTGSMTAAGIAILSMAREALGKKTPKDVDEAIENALAWLEPNFSLVKNPADRPGEGGYLFYYLFGIERIGSFLQRDEFAGKNWYLQGAKRILRFQKQDGSWSNSPTTRELELLSPSVGSSAISDTCFALLFLRRASARTGEQSSKPDSYQSDNAGDQVMLRASGRSGGITVWIAGFNPAVKSRYGSGETVRGLRVGKVVYLVDGEPVTEVPGDPSQPWKVSDRFTQNLWIGAGEHTISARVDLVDPDALAGATDATITLTGPGFSVEVKHHSRRFDHTLTGLAGRNLIGEGSKCKVSSNEGSAGFALDGIYATRWLCATDDKSPKVQVTLKKASSADTIILCQAARRRDEHRDFDRVTQLQVRINKAKEPLVVDVASSILDPIRIDLPEPVTIRTIEFEVLEREEGARSDGQLGFSEIAVL